MNKEDKKRLCGFLMGTSISLVPAMQRLGIEDGLTITRVEIADAIQMCRVCHKWKDLAVMDRDLCPLCDSIVNSENKEQSCND